MPVTKTITLYHFDELDETAKRKAIDDHSDWNVNEDWWDFTYEDAKNIGLEITSFDLNHRTIEGNLIKTVEESCEQILKNHGENCDTHKLALEYKALSEAEICARRCLGQEWDFEPESDEYKKELLRLYLHMLQDEYEYLTGEESISESLQANEVLFYANGKSYR